MQFFTGKGGVGKSSVIGALATAAARAGKRPLIVELGIHTSSSHLFHGPNVSYQPSEVAPGVLRDSRSVRACAHRLHHISSQASLRGDSGRPKQLTSTLFMAAPGVDEIVTLHRVAQLASDERWGPILVDLESTGHALMFFDLPSVLEVFLKDGPLRQVLDSATGWSATRDDPPSTSSRYRSLWPSTKRFSSIVRLRDRKDLHLGCLFINRSPRVWLDDDERQCVRQELERAGVDEPWAPDLALAEYLARRSETADKCLRGLRRDIDLPTLTFGASEADGAAIIEELASAFERDGALVISSR